MAGESSPRHFFLTLLKIRHNSFSSRHFGIFLFQNAGIEIAMFGLGDSYQILGERKLSKKELR